MNYETRPRPPRDQRPTHQPPASPLQRQPRAAGYRRGHRRAVAGRDGDGEGAQHRSAVERQGITMGRAGTAQGGET